jgi:AcrR family transcriptional regulator
MTTSAPAGSTGPASTGPAPTGPASTGPHSATAAPVSRRQRLRDATSEEIKAVARDLMAREGTASLNLRAIAREMGMTPSALYRYYPSRDAILTALITDAYDSVGEAVETAIDRAPHDRTCSAILAGVHTFRWWALDHPQEFGLIYGSPVPGYEAPAEETDAAAMRTSIALLQLLVRAVEQGVMRLPADDVVPEPLRGRLAELGGIKSELGISPGGHAVAMQFWVVLLGILSAEVFGHLPAGLLEQGQDFFDFTMRQALVAMGAEPSAVAAGVVPERLTA